MSDQRTLAKGSHPRVDQARSVPWHPRYRQGVLKLLSAVPYKAEIWEWEFESNPFGKPFSPVLMVDPEDQVVGFNGVMPIEASEWGRPIDALWSCDFHVAPGWRGLGLGSRIKAELHQKARTLMAFGISDQASLVLQHLGWQPDWSVRNYRLLRQRKGWRDWMFMALQCFNRLRGLLESSRERLSVGVRSTLPEPALVNTLWEREKAGYPRVVRRSHAYLDWKYQQHPLARYAFVCAWEGERLAALLVVRYHGQTLRIVDYSGPAKGLGLKRALIRYVRVHWRHAGQILSVTSDFELGRSLKAEGFFSPRTRPRFFVHEADEADFDRSHHWFIMAGDSDGELLGAAGDFCGGEPPPVITGQPEQDGP